MKKLTNDKGRTFGDIMNYLILIMLIVLGVALIVWVIWFKYHEDANLEWGLLGNLSFIYGIFHAQ